ncbi:MAG: 50S ribosomal protein L29 [Parcubacteria group bacterium]|jgi:ribosomal protein L29|nr:50S ribosomal protein L29 [Parcubacteria group bacterium]|tara:strand:- start:20770 stop:21018 length:249 start_codon:yes stop_codon:yes gene_type:complete
MKYKELKNKSDKELNKILTDWQEKLRDLKFKTAADQLKNIRELRDVKKTIAKTIFLLSQKNKDNVPAKVIQIKDQSSDNKTK